MIKFDFTTYTKDFICDEEIKEYEKAIPSIKSFLNSKNDMMGWYDLDELFNKQLIDDIDNTASYIRDNCDVFLIVAIGGAYLVSFSAIEALKPYFYNQTQNPQVYFIGPSLSSDYYHDLSELIKAKQIIVNVISKSGTTLETITAYQFILELMKEKYDDAELKKRIIITTDKENGILRMDINKLGYKSFVVPSNIGDRYSVFSPNGLLPLAVANIDIRALYEGAKSANSNIDNQIRYAIIREIMYKKGKKVEAFVVYEPKLHAFTEWLKQLYGESLGKEEKGILPISIVNVRDLHSLGQFMQQGNKILFETVINIENSNNNITIEKYNKSLNEINNIASVSTSKAHLNGGVLNNIITISKLDTETLGYLLQFFMVSCAISGFIAEVDPFNQEGVEEYKRIMREAL